MGTLQIFLAVSFLAIAIVATASLFVARSKELKDYPEVATVSVFLALSALFFFALSGVTVYLGLSNR